MLGGVVMTDALLVIIAVSLLLIWLRLGELLEVRR